MVCVWCRVGLRLVEVEVVVLDLIVSRSHCSLTFVACFHVLKSLVFRLLSIIESHPLFVLYLAVCPRVSLHAVSHIASESIRHAFSTSVAAAKSCFIHP